MKCMTCSAVMPFMADEPAKFDCIFCGGTQFPDEVDLLSQAALGFVREVRDGQIQLTERISDNIRDNGTAIFEAGTGVGKSFAYLLPAVLSGKRVIISTGKKTLQEQLLEKDLPYIQEQLRVLGHKRANFKYFGAYGKSNYACKKKVEQATDSGILSAKVVSNFKKFFQSTDFGRWEDKQAAGLKLDKALNADACVGPECIHYRNCGYIKAKQQVSSADIVVTNNWLLGYHYRLRREQSEFKLLGDFDHVIVDEAHQIETGIRSAFTDSITLDFLKTINTRIKEVETYSGKPTSYVVNQSFNALSTAWTPVFEALKRVHNSGNYKLNASAVADLNALDTCLTSLANFFTNTTYLQGVFDCPKYGITNATFSLLREIQDSTPSPVTQLDQLISRVGFPYYEKEREIFIALSALLIEVASTQRLLSTLTALPETHTWALDKVHGKYYLQVMPVDIGNYLPDKGMTYLSATLAIDNKFDVFAQRVGLSSTKYDSDIFPSPFNLPRQAYFYTPAKGVIPDPRVPRGQTVALNAYRDAVAEQVYQLTYANQGDAFVLFTANEELEHVKKYMHSKAFPYPIFAQGDFTPNETLTRYRETPKATLLGVKSFWEGIDVSGDKLSLVIITKLPFPRKTDPIIAARCDKYQNAFFSMVFFPEMVMDLRQGIGRLVRTKTDRGIIALLDPRIHNNVYGRTLQRIIGLPIRTNLDIICKSMATRHAR